MDSSCPHTWHMGVTHCQSRWAQGLGSGCHCGVEPVEVRQAATARAASGGEGKQALTGAPGTLSLPLSPMAGGGWTSAPLLGTAVCPSLSGTWPLGCEGLVFAGGCFQVTLQSPQMAPGVGPPPRCVGRGGVLDNLMFSTLTPFLSLKGVGAAAKAAGGLDPAPYTPVLVVECRAGPWGLSRICPPPLWQEHGQVTWPWLTPSARGSRVADSRVQ